MYSIFYIVCNRGDQVGHAVIKNNPSLQRIRELQVVIPTTMDFHVISFASTYYYSDA
jgi:hypothetical protein